MSVAQWVADRLPTDRRHLDAAACGRISTAVLEAECAFLRAEAEVGAYVAEAAAQPDIDAGRDALAAVVGLTGETTCFFDGGATAFAVVLDGWPLERGARIGTIPGEYGGNARVLRRRAELCGWELVTLEVDDLGRITALPAGLDLVTFPQVLSQRGVVQPTEDLIASGVPVLLDVAQSAGQVEVPPGAAAYVGTSRKWLCGPRGVGFACLSDGLELADPPTLGPAHHRGSVRRFDSTEPHVAGRIGLSLAARTWSPAVLPVAQAAAAAARVLLQGAGGWQVVEPVEEPTAITTLVHDDLDPLVVRARLVDEGFVVSVVPVSRADDMTRPVLRVSTPAWVTPDDLEALAVALDSVGSVG